MLREWGNDDAALLAELDQAWYAVQRVPAEFIAAGRAVWVPPDLDAELAQLVYDSQREPALTRTQTARLRALTFASATQTIELEIGDGKLLGQLVPPVRVEIELEVHGGGTTVVTSDELGFFSIPHIPDGRFRLRCRVSATVDVVTSWIAI